MSSESPARRPFVATYRLQMGPGFAFREAAALVPYIRNLGVSHLYLSPIWECLPGSTHGYDVVDHNAIREELGGREGFLELVAAARTRGLGIIVDIVPNHVGVAGGRQAWWRDVLRSGETSPFAPYFDIDWHGHGELQPGVLVLPVLGQPFGEALESGEISLGYDGAEIVVACYEARYPVSIATYRTILGRPPRALRGAVNVPASAKDLPGFAAAVSSSSKVRDWVEDRLRSFSGSVGDHASWDVLETILAAQHYRLAFWRVSGEQVNYRRFFEINELAAIRQEHPGVFEATHGLLAELLGEGLIDGVRVDHIDGLYDPARYLHDLAGITGIVPIWVEKILARSESVPGDWPIAGTTGYDFLAMADGLFIDAESERPMTAAYAEFTGDDEAFSVAASEARHDIAATAFPGEVAVLAAQLFRLAQADRRYRDITLHAFRDAVEALLASFPVYRTYFEQGSPRAGDRALIESAAAAARELEPALVPGALEFLVRVLLLDSDRPSAEGESGWVHFRRRFQQTSGPIMAKGVEDTAFFRYNRLLALNEVGASPAEFGTAKDAFHAWASERAASTPLALSATSTHDTKRSEDARMRLAVLSEVPAAWRREVRAWARLNARHHTEEPIDAATEYYFYQTLVATFEGTTDEAFATRIVEHMRKAAREAKRRTSWSDPDADYENALEALVRAALDPRRSRRFLDRLGNWVGLIAPAAEVNSLALLTLKCLAPGVPDIYQGSEARFLALTDPDNRRPPDYPALAKLASDAAKGARPASHDSRKVWLLQRLLGLRADMPDLFAHGSWEPLEPDGEAAEHVVAFAREHPGEIVVAAVPRLISRFVGPRGELSLPGPLSLALPTEWARWRDALSLSSIKREPAIDLASRFAAFPVVILRAEKEAK